MSEANPYATELPHIFHGAGDRLVSIEALNYDLSIGESSGIQSKKKRDPILRDDEQELFGVFDQTYGAPAADTLISQAESYGMPPQSEDEALERLISMTEAARIHSEGKTGIIFVQFARIRGRPHLMWANFGGSSQLYIQPHTAADVVPMHAAQPTRRRARPVLLQSEYMRERDNNGKIFGVLPLRGNERILICSKGVVGNNGTQPVALRNIFELDDPQHAAERIAQASIENQKAALVIDVHALAPGEKPKKIPKKSSVMERFDKTLATIAESRPRETFRKAKAALGRLAVRKHTGAFANHRGKVETLRQKSQHAKAKIFAGTVAAAQASAEYYAHETKGKRRRVAVMGLLALAGTMYTAYKFGIFTGNSSQAQSALHHTPNHASIFDQPKATPLNLPQDPLIQPGGGMSHSHDTAQEVVRSKPKTTVQFTIRGDGDGIWSTIKDYFHTKQVDASDQRITRLAQRVMAERQLSVEDTLHLPRGWRFSLPKGALR